MGTVHVQIREDADGQAVLNAVSVHMSQALKGAHAVHNLSVQIEKEQFLNGLEPEKRMLVTHF